MRRAAYRVITPLVAAAMAVPPVHMVYANIDTANTEMRRQVVKLAGIMDQVNSEKVTRREFAKMLVQASTFRDNLPKNAVMVYSDVPQNDPDAVYIRIASDQKLMSGFLGGVFRPNDYITYKDAVHATLCLLGYSDSDFQGDRISSEISMFHSLQLNEKVRTMHEDEIPDRYDCASIFYNLLKCPKKGSTEIYGKPFDCVLNSDGEINPVGIVKDKRVGPILVRKSQDIRDLLPFGGDDVNVFFNGVKSASTLADVNRRKKEAGFAVMYYHAKSKTVWVYTDTGWNENDESGKSQYVLIRGEIRNIYYKSTEVVTPTAIKLQIYQTSDNDEAGVATDDYGNVTINLNSTELQYMFSIYGDLKVGDQVVLVCEGTTDKTTEYTAVDAIKY